MQEYGYQILQALVTDMDPDQRVKGAMNEINASKRLREAATNKAEADKIMQVCFGSFRFVSVRSVLLPSNGPTDGRIGWMDGCIAGDLSVRARTRSPSTRESSEKVCAEADC